MRNWVLVSLLAFGLFLPASALGREWSYEKVAAAGSWSDVEVEVMPGGTICVCYRDSVSQTIMLASRDTAWRYETLGFGNGTVGRHLVPGPGGRPAVLTCEEPITYKVDTGTGWVTTTLGWSGGGSTFLAFDTSGNPAVLWVFGGGEELYLSSARESAGVWIQDTIYSWWPSQETPYWGGNQGFVVDRANCFYAMFMSDLLWWSGLEYCNVILGTYSAGSWTTSLLAGGAWCFASGLSLALRPSSGVSACYNLGYRQKSDSFYCDQTAIDTQTASIGLVRVDAQNHRQIVYRTDRLRFAYETTGWNFDTLPSVMDVSSLDFAVDTNGRPLIAFVSDSGVFLARGGPASGCAEQKPAPVAEHLVLPAIVRGVLELPGGSDFPVAKCRGSETYLTFLLDISGRKVMELHPGANDVSRFGAGVYFIRGLGSGTRGQGEVRKVVITR